MGLLFTILLITNTVFAFPNEPEGFRTMKWGDTIEKFEIAGGAAAWTDGGQFAYRFCFSGS